MTILASNYNTLGKWMIPFPLKMSMIMACSLSIKTFMTMEPHCPPSLPCLPFNKTGMTFWGTHIYFNNMLTTTKMNSNMQSIIYQCLTQNNIRHSTKSLHPYLLNNQTCSFSMDLVVQGKLSYTTHFAILYMQMVGLLSASIVLVRKL